MTIADIIQQALTVQMMQSGQISNGQVSTSGTQYHSHTQLPIIQCIFSDSYFSKLVGNCITWNMYEKSYLKERKKWKRNLFIAFF